MSTHDLQSIARTIQGLQHRIGAIDNELRNADRAMADCQVNINRLRNIQATMRNQTTPGAQQLRRDLTMWENRFRTASTRFYNLKQTKELTVNQRRNAQARLEYLQNAREVSNAAAIRRGRGSGRRL